jgi:glucose-1-phosphate thymidylyltransferase
MTCIILAAGYATRMHPLTLNYPKPLLKINGIPIINYLIEDIKPFVDEFIIVTNHKFINYFKDYDCKVIDDGSTDNENRLGAVNDIKLAIENINDDVFIAAGDNLLDFSLNEFFNFIHNKKTSCIMYYDENDINKQRKTAIIEKDNDLVISFEEKPINPKTNLAVPPFYYYTKNDVEKIKYINNINTDAPGSLAKWFCENSTLNGFKMNGNRYDIGDIENYNKINNLFSERE